MTTSDGGQPCVFYNEDNAVAQCHRCGHVYTPASKSEYANWGARTKAEPEDSEELPSNDPEIVSDGILRIRTCIVEAIESARSDYRQALTDGYYTEKSEGCRDLINSYKTMLFHIDAIIRMQQVSSPVIFSTDTRR